MKKSLRMWTLLLLFFVGLPGGLVADEGDDAPSGLQATDQPVLYETATVRARPISRATASVTVLDREAIEALNVASVAELMRFVAGVDVSSTGPRGGLATAQIRGGDPNYTTVLLDGVPLNDITDQVGGAVNLNSLSTAHIERIEIVRGPLSSFFGSTGLAGAINIVTRRGDTTTPAWSFDVAGGDDSTALASAAFSQGNEHQDYFIGLSWEQEKNGIDREGITRTTPPQSIEARDEFKQFAVQGNARIAIGDQAELRITGRFSSWDTEDYPDASGGPIFDAGVRESKNDEFNLGVELGIGSAGRRHKILATAYRHELDRVSAGVPGAVPASTEDTTFTTWQLGYSAPPIEFRSVQLNLAADARVEDGTSDRFFPDFFGSGPVSDSYRIQRTSGGVFAEFLAEWDRLLLEVGTRVDLHEDAGAEFNPRAGVSFRLPGDKTRLRLSVGRAFKLPSFFALADPIVGNPDLDPETVLGADVGVEHTFASIHLTAALNLFFNQFDDLVTFDSTTFMIVNVEGVESQGAELTVDWNPVGALAVHANVTHQDFEFDDGPLTQRPEWVGAARFVWSIKQRTRWELDGQWVSEVLDFQNPLVSVSNPSGTATTSGYQLFGTALSVEVAPRWEVHARVDNLADKEYEPFIGFPGPDRSFRIGLRHRSR